MIMKKIVVKITLGDIQALIKDIATFKSLLYDILKLWIPHSWDGNGEIYQKEVYKSCWDIYKPTSNLG